MDGRHAMVILIAGILGAAGVGPIAAAAAEPACPAEVAQAKAMVARARGVLEARNADGTRGAGMPMGERALEAEATPAPTPGSGSRALQGDPTSVAGRTPLLDQGTGTARGLATSAAAEISPWNPQPTDKTLQARTAQARDLSDEAGSLCRAGKTEDAKSKALEAIGVLNPK